MSEENDNVAPMNNEMDISMEEQEVETTGSAKENQDTSRLEILEDMLSEVLEKQRNFELSNTEVVNELRSVKSELQLIRDEMKPKIVTAAVPVKADENKIDSDSNNESATTTGKYFELKHVFKNVSNLDHLDRMYSEKEEHFGVPWRILIQRDEEHLGIFLCCAAEMDDRIMSFDVEYKTNIMSTNTRKWSKKERDVFQNSKLKNEWGCTESIEWAEVEKDFLVDDQLTGEIHVKIKKTTGIYKDNLRIFDQTMEEFSDVVLVVDEEKFYVSKLKYIEVLYGERAIDEFTVEGILMVADMYDTPMVIRKCEEFLLKESKKTLKKKLQMSMRYHLEALNKQCRKEIKSVADIKSVLPGDIRDLDPSITTEFLEIALSVQ